jgi:hypothetical protein
MTLPVQPDTPTPFDPSYTLWAVLRRDPGAGLDPAALSSSVQELDAAVAAVEAT